MMELTRLRAGRAEQTACILAVGTEAERATMSRMLTRSALWCERDFNRLDADTVRASHVVMAPVIANGFDCFDVAQRLNDWDFDGVFRVIAENLPQPDMVASELSEAFPLLTVEVRSVTAPMSMRLI